MIKYNFNSTFQAYVRQLKRNHGWRKNIYKNLEIIEYIKEHNITLKDFFNQKCTLKWEKNIVTNLPYTIYWNK